MKSYRWNKNDRMTKIIYTHLRDRVVRLDTVQRIKPFKRITYYISTIPGGHEKITCNATFTGWGKFTCLITGPI